MVAILYAGAFAEQVEHLCLIEGLGPPEQDVGGGPDRLRGFAQDVAKYSGGRQRIYDSVEAAAARVKQNNPSIGDEDALHYARTQGLTVTRPDGPDGSEGRTWRYDPRQHVRAAFTWQEASLRPFLERITAKVLVVEGEQGMVLDDATRARRLGYVKGEVQSLRVPGAGHHVHLNAPDVVAAAIDRLLDE